MTDIQMPSAFTPFDLSISIPHSEPPVIDVASTGRPGKSYKVDIVSQTCTCPDFLSHRSRFIPSDHMGRFCKHLMATLQARGAFDYTDKWLRAIAHAGHGGPYDAWIVRAPRTSDMLVTASYGTQWINIYAHSKRSGERIADASGEILQYGWMPTERRWSYGESPPGSSYIKPLLRIFEDAYYEEATNEETELVDWRQFWNS